MPAWKERLEPLLEVEGPVDRVDLAGRAVLWVALAIWGVRLMAVPVAGGAIGRSWMHLVNLPFHEAGHLIFLPFGHFLHVLGGSLGQLLMPLIVIVAFLRRGNRFGATVGLWWLAESLMDLAPYIDDARVQRLVLLGGVTGQQVPHYHDWNEILGLLHWMRYDHLLAHLAEGTGMVLMLAALAWGAALLWRMRRVV